MVTRKGKRRSTGAVQDLAEVRGRQPYSGESPMNVPPSLFWIFPFPGLRMPPSSVLRHF